jgi:hypothetical protein
MACPDLYPPTPQDSPHATPETTPHLSLHRRALLNQHMGSLPGSDSASPQLHRQSFTHSIASDDLDEIPEYPPPPYPGLANGDVSTSIPENTTDNATEVDNTAGVMPGIENLIVSQPESDSSAASSPNQNSSPLDDQENPWVLNNVGNSHLRDRDHNPPSRVNTEQYPMRARTLSDDSARSNENSQEESTSSSNSQVLDTTSESAHSRNPKPGIESGSQDVGLRVAVVWWHLIINLHHKTHFHSRKFSAEKNFVKFDWPTQIFRLEKNFEVENRSTFNNDIFGTFSVRGKVSWVEMGS